MDEEDLQRHAAPRVRPGFVHVLTSAEKIVAFADHNGRLFLATECNVWVKGRGTDDTMRLIQFELPEEKNNG